MKFKFKEEYEPKSQSPFIDGIKTCPKCEKTNWDCNVTEDGGLVYCRHVSNSSGVRDSKGRYQHFMNNDVRPNINRPKSKLNVEAMKANVDTINEVYSAFLESLSIRDRHFYSFMKRGLSLENIDEKKYRSVPENEDKTEVVSSLDKSFNLEGIPGFYFDGKVWRLNMTFAGFYVPYRDEKGRIVGLQIRRDEYEEGGKYLWLSSRGKEKGVSSGSPLHFVNPERANLTKVVYLTEGALKADIIGSKINVGLVASAGVGAINPNKLFDSVHTAFPDLEEIVLAYDMDWKTNENVRFALKQLINALKEKDIIVTGAVWDSGLGKGLDDVLGRYEYKQGDFSHISVEQLLGYMETFEAKESENTETENVCEETPKLVSVDDALSSEESEDETSEETVDTEESKDLGKSDSDSFRGDESQAKEESKHFPENHFMFSCGDFLDADFPELDKILLGLVRTRLNMVVATTNLGKTTLALNLSLSAVARKEFYPLFNESHSARRILYIDGEASKAELQADIKKMLEVFSPEQVKLVRENLFVVCDAELNDEPLDLVNKTHLEVVMEKALTCQPDLIIIDTLSALMTVEDENDNAKVKKEVIDPLKHLARQTNSAVLLLHHSGKYNETFTNNKAYNGRGASAFGAMSRSVITLEKNNKKDDKDNSVILRLPKAKGDKLEATVLELDTKSRWFKVAENVKVETVEKATNKQLVIDYVLAAGKEVKRSQINIAFNRKNGRPFIADSTITSYLSEARDAKILESPRFGYWSAPRNVEGEIPLAE